MKICFTTFLVCFFALTSHAQDIWTQRANFGGTARHGAVGFSIGSKGYVGTGFDDRFAYKKDFWEYDPDLNVWTQKADFGGSVRSSAVGFSIGSKGYLGTGTIGYSFYKDFWEYDPEKNSWTQKANFGGPGRFGAVGFSIGSKGYLGTGGVPSISDKDFWEYDPELDTWMQKADFGGTARTGAVGFSIGTKGYIGTGEDINEHFYRDFWEYDPTTNRWTQKVDFGGIARAGAVGFSIGTKGYIGMGAYPSLKDFWEYDPELNTWTKKADFGGISRWDAVGFSIGSKGYVGTGTSNGPTDKDFWEYTPDCTDPVITSVTASTNPICKGKSTDLSVTGTLNGAATWQWYTVSCGGTPAGSGLSITVSPASTTTYYVRGEGGCVTAESCSSITVTVNKKPKAEITALGSLDICATGSVDLQASSGNGYTYQWMLNGSKISGATKQTYYATQVGDYTVKVTNNQGCTNKSKATTVFSSCRLAALQADAIEIHPNPASDQTTIQFTLSETSRVRLVVFDVNGKEIKTLLNEIRDQGSYTVQVNLSSFLKGIYTVRMITDTGTENQKLVVE